MEVKLGILLLPETCSGTRTSITEDYSREFHAVNPQPFLGNVPALREPLDGTQVDTFVLLSYGTLGSKKQLRKVIIYL